MRTRVKDLTTKLITVTLINKYVLYLKDMRKNKYACQKGQIRDGQPVLQVKKKKTFGYNFVITVGNRQRSLFLVASCSVFIYPV